jgi:hypothetical protein
MTTNIKKTIIINHLSDLYEIPEPNELITSIGVCYILHYNTNTNSKNTHTKIEAKQFFIYNPDIFQIYFEKIINNLPTNFYMFIDQILYLIKTKNMVETVDEYWKKMIVSKK